jgi:N-acetylglutamate synthase-like GNAT family acetyltransferase
MTPADGCTVRPARDADAAGVIALIGGVYAEYPGNVLDVETEERGLLAPASSFERFWVAERDGAIVGSCALVSHRRGGELTVEMKKVYVAAPLRGTGLAQRLVALVEQHASSAGASRIELWSDTRFTRGHSFYARLGYRRTGRTRELHDLSNSVEYEFVKVLR